MRRRDFIKAIAGTGPTWPLAVYAQLAMPVIGILQMGTPDSYDLSGLRQGLKEAGFSEGENLAVEYRWANDDANRLPELAADLVRRRVAVIVPLANSPAALAAKDATATIPIVFGYGGDPVRQGLVASINRPGRNITGVTSLSGELGGKRLGLLHELLPGVTRFALLARPGNPTERAIVVQAQSAGAAIGGQIELCEVNNAPEIDNAFAKLAQDRIQALLVASDVLFIVRRIQIVMLAMHDSMPTIYPFREDAQAGGLISYGPNLSDRDRLVGLYIGRILRGEKPEDLPVVQANKFELVINLQTAKTLGIDIPTTLLARADEVIE